MAAGRRVFSRAYILRVVVLRGHLSVGGSTVVGRGWPTMYVAEAATVQLGRRGEKGSGWWSGGIGAWERPQLTMATMAGEVRERGGGVGIR